MLRLLPLGLRKVVEDEGLTGAGKDSNSYAQK